MGACFQCSALAGFRNGMRRLDRISKRNDVKYGNENAVRPCVACLRVLRDSRVCDLISFTDTKEKDENDHLVNIFHTTAGG